VSGFAVTPAVQTQAGDVIVALGTVRPAQTRQLSFRAGGPVASTPVRLGQPVQAGDLLSELDATALQLALEKAEAQVAIEQAALDALLNGPSQVEIERAEAAHTQQVTQAEFALREAKLQLEEARLSSPNVERQETQLERARLDLQLAQARAESPQAEVTVAQVGLARAQETLAKAQDEYRRALDRPWEPQRIRDALAEGVQQAQWDVKIAQARLDAAQDAQRAHAYGLAVLAAQGGTLELQKERALEAQATYSVTLALLGVRVEQAKRRLDTLNAWVNPLLDPSPPEVVAQAQARLRQAQTIVEQMRWQLDGTQLCAPLDGVVSAVHVHPGEWAAEGRPVIDVIDATHWIVETRNVSESDIGGIRVGEQAEVQVLALGSQAVRGEVAAISPVAVVQQGDTTYTLTIALDPTELALWSGMNAQVRIRQ
jgi:HlyD family secretion protein